MHSLCRRHRAAACRWVIGQSSRTRFVAPDRTAPHCTIFRWSLQWLPALPGLPPSSLLSAPAHSAQCSPKHPTLERLELPASAASSSPSINNPAKAAAPASHLRRLTPKLLPPFPDRHSRVRQSTVSLNFGRQHQRVHRRPRIHTVATLPRSQGPYSRVTAGPPRHIVRLPSSLPATDRPCRIHHCRPKLQQPNPDRQTAERRPLVGGRLDRRYVL